MQAILSLTVSLFVMAWSSAPVQADTLPAPEADIVLTVSGEISVKNADDTAVFDLQMLRDLPSHTISTTTLWTDGVQEFQGVPLKALLEILDFKGSLILASAINDYTVEIPADSLTDTAPIVAYSANGEDMPRRQKGPLWILYPYDSDPDFRTEVIYSRSIWQLDRLALQQ